MQNENNSFRKHIKLEDIQKKNVYKVPGAYFEQLPRQIQTRIAARNKTWKWDWAFVPETRMARAAVLLLMVVCGIVFINIRNNNITKHLATTKVISTKKLNKLNSNSEEILSLKPDFYNKIEVANVPKKYLKNVPQPMETIALPIQDSTFAETIAALKIDAATIIANLDKEEISNYLKTEDSEEYEWEEVSAKL